jgi:hypothetical protein
MSLTDRELELVVVAAYWNLRYNDGISIPLLVLVNEVCDLLTFEVSEADRLKAVSSLEEKSRI